MAPATENAKTSMADGNADSVMTTLRQLGLAPLPRNYEFLYELYKDASPDTLQQIIAKLGSHPGQENFDRLIESHAEVTATGKDRAKQQKSSAELARVSVDLAVLLKDEIARLEGFNNEIDAQGKQLVEQAYEQTVLYELSKNIADTITSNIVKGEVVLTKLHETNAELQRVRDELTTFKRLSHVDALTDLNNRRYFDDVLGRLYSLDGIEDTALLLLDLDYFKEVNDTFGHQTGDNVLKNVAGLLKKHVRDTDLVARTGGEEFGVVLLGTTKARIMQIAERLRGVIAETSVQIDDETSAPLTVTASIGICIMSDANNHEQLYQFADEALYASKQNGRNQVTVYGQETGENALRKQRLRIYQEF
ncbi:MAG: GGDEF domain-containing protein [Anderseniella sp.]